MRMDGVIDWSRHFGVACSEQVGTKMSESVFDGVRAWGGFWKNSATGTEIQLWEA